MPSAIDGGKGMAGDTSLWPVVVGGLLTGVFALGGIGIGSTTTARRDAAQQRREDKKRRADKFEELVAAVYEFDHWLDDIRNAALGAAEASKTVSPFAKVQAISSIYFPQFSEIVRELGKKSNQLLVWVHLAEHKRVTGNIDNIGQGFGEIYTPYAQQFGQLTEALTKFAAEEFQ